MPTTKKQSAYHFFYAHGGYSYNLKIETAIQGRRRCAKSLAAAERYARENRFSFQWEIDKYDTSADFCECECDTLGTLDCGKCCPRRVWNCIARDASGEIIGSLCAIDFGRDGEPWSDPYRRIVEAELAAEAI